MTRRSLLTVVLGLFAIPALGAPQLKPENKRVGSLIGTTWSGNSFEMQTMTFTFKADGQIVAVYNGGLIKESSWHQEGEKIFIAINNNYLKFEGKVVGDKIEGECFNVACQRWKVTMEKGEPPPAKK